MHFLYQRKDPVFEFIIVCTWNNRVSLSVQLLVSKFSSFHLKIPHKCWGQTFHKIFFYTACCGNDAVDHLVLAKIPDDLSHSTRDYIRSISQIDRASYLLSICHFFEMISLIGSSDSLHLIISFIISIASPI